MFFPLSFPPSLSFSFSPSLYKINKIKYIKKNGLCKRACSGQPRGRLSLAYIEPPQTFQNSLSSPQPQMRGKSEL